MVVVAGVALSSSTYAWFVSNNSVKATTTSIYAQSNSAYLLIANETDATTANNKGSIAKDASEAANIALYPATWTNTLGGSYLFATGYAATPGNPAINSAGLFAIQSDGETDGSPEAAVAEDYAYLNTFYIGTGDYDGSFTNLKVTNMNITVTGSNELSGALRVLVKCGDQWVVGKVFDSAFTIESQSGTGGIIRAEAFGKSAMAGDPSQSVGDVQVDVYVYYEGSDEKVYSDNLSKINADGVKATVTFEATPAEFGAGA